MTIAARIVPGISVAVVSLGLVLSLVSGPAAVAQDAMQLDLMFKESLSSPAREVQKPRDDERRHVRGRRDKPRRDQQRIVRN
jgi:hypothetical protein